MSVLRGTADNYLDLVARLDAFLTQQGHAWGRTYTGAGNGRLLGTDGSEGGYIGGPDSVAETFTLTATGATTFTVEGTVTGALPDATVGTPYVAPQLEFLLEAGDTAFQAGDRFTINTTPPWERLVRRGVIERAYRTAVNFTDTQNAYTSNTQYAAATALPAELRLESPWPIPVGEYTITADTLATTPRDWTLDYSDDGSTWATADTRSGVTWALASTARTFQVPGTPGEHKHWRLRFTAGNGTGVRVQRLQIKAATNDTATQEDGAWIAWRAPGADGAQEINIAMRLRSDQAAGTYNLGFYGSRFWANDLPPELQVNTSGERLVSVYNSPMPFTFVANGHRLVPIIKVGTSYMAAYLGHRRSYDPPSADPWPCIIAGNHDSPMQNYATVPATTRNVWNAGQRSTAVHHPNGAWVSYSNIALSGGNETAENSTLHPGKVYPSALGGVGHKFEYARDNIDGSYTLIPCTLLCETPRHVAGELDGLYWVPGFNNTAENIVRREGFAHLCIPNINRTGGADFAAIRLD